MTIINRIILFCLQFVLFSTVPILFFGILVTTGLAFFYDFTMLDALVNIGISLAIFFVIALISPLITPILVLLTGARIPTTQELGYIVPALEDVIESCQLKKNLSICVIDDNLQSNAMVLGRSIIFTSGIINNSSESEIRAVIAHELGHIAHGDANFNIVSNFISQPIAFLLAFLNGLAAMGQGLPLLKLVIGLPAYLLIGLFNIILFVMALLVTALSRSCEYKADKYALVNGYGDGLISFLQLIAQSQSKRNFMQAIVDTHPAPQKRILRLEKLERNGY